MKNSNFIKPLFCLSKTVRYWSIPTASF